MNENTKDVEIGGRKWRVKKFDARTGSYMLVKIVGIMAPAFKDISAKEGSGVNFNEIAKGISGLPEQDFVYVQDKCLRACFEILPAGEAPVLDINGNFSAIGVEYDLSIVMGLTIHALVFNVAGFFGGSLLSSLGGGIANIFPPKSKT